MKLGQLKKDYLKHGRAPVIRVLNEALSEDGEHRLRPEAFSIQELWEAFVGPVRQTLTSGDGGYVTLHEDAVSSNAFSDIIGVLLASKVIEGYNMPGYIGDQLVTVMSSSRKTERYAGFTDIEQPDDVGEAMPYPETGFGDKYATSEAFKKGRILNVTEEAIKFDQTGQLLTRAAFLGEKCRLERETVILNGVMDTAATVFSPQGAAEALYRVAAGTNSTTINRLAANLLVDWTDIDNIMQIFAAMADSQGDRIVVIPKILLVPYALDSTAKRIINATEIRHTSATATIQTISGNPVSGIRPLSSPLIDDQSSTTYYLGDPARQFIWHQIWPVQVTRKRLEVDAHNRDIVVSFKVRYYGGIAAIDDKYVVQSTA